MLNKIIENFPDEEFLTVDGFNDAIIGVEPLSMRLIYSVSKCIEILMRNIKDEVEAIEYFYYNVTDAYMGEKTPIWCEDFAKSIREERKEKLNILSTY